MHTHRQFTETVIYRYFFYDWMFKDMRIARNVFEWAAFWRHNKSMKGYLWIYLMRWCAISAIAFGIGMLFGDAIPMPVMAGLGFAGGSVALCVMIVIGTSWALLAWSE